MEEGKIDKEVNVMESGGWRMRGQQEQGMEVGVKRVECGRGWVKKERGRRRGCCRNGRVGVGGRGGRKRRRRRRRRGIRKRRRLMKVKNDGDEGRGGQGGQRKRNKRKRRMHSGPDQPRTKM